MIGGISYFHEFAFDLLAENERILASTFEAAIAAHKAGRLQRIVVLSSSMVFESTTVFPTPEGAERTSPPPISTYGFQKLASEYFAHGAWEQYQLPYTILRPFNCVGIGERRAVRDTDVMSGNVKLALSHVVPDLVLKTLKGQDPLHILGDGSQVRHYTYGGDLAHGIRLAMESRAAVNDDFNLSTAASTTVLELAEAIWTAVHGPDEAVPLRLGSAVRARRPAARPRRAQGPRRARVRGDDLARHDAGRGDPVDPRGARGRPAVTAARRRTVGRILLGTGLSVFALLLLARTVDVPGDGRPSRGDRPTMAGPAPWRPRDRVRPASAAMVPAACVAPGRPYRRGASWLPSPCPTSPTPSSRRGSVRSRERSWSHGANGWRSPWWPHR